MDTTMNIQERISAIAKAGWQVQISAAPGMAEGSVSICVKAKREECSRGDDKVWKNHWLEFKAVTGYQCENGCLDKILSDVERHIAGQGWRKSIMAERRCDSCGKLLLVLTDLLPSPSCGHELVYRCHGCLTRNAELLCPVCGAQQTFDAEPLAGVPALGK
jgi:predicted RNA-binding Zn-ribbon protein involved in translation (DUF1610 family)